MDLLPYTKTQYPNVVRTGLHKRCPRCKRLGEVFADTKYQNFVITWEGPSQSTITKAKHDIDIALGPSDLLDPEMGCGYDH